MKKKNVVGVALALTMAAGVTVPALGNVRASADDITPLYRIMREHSAETLRAQARAGEYELDFEGSAVNPGGYTNAEIKAAVAAKIKEINDSIDALGDKTLADAYAAGEILLYSTIEGSNGKITADNRRSGWKVWEGAAMADIKQVNDGKDWDGHTSFITFNGKTGKAHIVGGRFADAYTSNQKLNSPLGDKVRVKVSDGYIEYQNFSGGYMKSVNGANCTIVTRKNVQSIAQDGTVTEVDADACSGGYLGAAPQSILDKAGVESKDFAELFENAYKAYAAAGFNVGYPFGAVSTKYGMTSQDFRLGDSVASPWGGDRSQWAYLAYNYEEQKVYLVKDEFMYVFENGGNMQDTAKQLGDPAGDVFEVNGNRYQNFSKGYMMASSTAPKNANVAKVVAGKQMTAEGNEVNIDASLRVGKLGPSAKANLPENMTEAELSAAFVALYNSDIALGEGLQAADLVEYANGVLLQAYTDDGGKVHAAMMNPQTKTVYYIRPAAYEKYKAGTDIGKPIKAAYEVASTAKAKVYAYAFSNGYIKLTERTETDFDDGGNVITVVNESAVATIGSVYNEQSNFFETRSYADDISADIVSDAVVTQSETPSKDAIWSKLNTPTDKATIAQAFRDAYVDAFEKGFSAGTPSHEGIIWWFDAQSGVIKLTLKGGNGNANFWGDQTLMTYNPADGKAYITTGTIANHYASDGANGNGWALGDMMLNTVTGDIIQNFVMIDPDTSKYPEGGRYVYIKYDGAKKTTSKNPGSFDFAEGNWVPYITQFGGSISAKPVTVGESYKKGEPVSIDFSQFVENKDGYVVSYTLTSSGGALSDAGLFTLTPDAAGTVTVTVEARSAFDKFTLTAVLNVTEDGTPTSEPQPDEEKPKKKGCGSAMGAVGSAGAGVVLLGAGAALLARKKKQENID
ncbi:MAG: hypothetical protein HFE46_05405 [Clostridia bacterium]|jgi:hypothetical protein|nr:hypothetical protein [Clostridia bacterium]